MLRGAFFYSAADIQKAMSDPGASGPGGVYNQIRASMSSSGGGGGGGSSTPSQPSSTPQFSTPNTSSSSGQYNTVNGVQTVASMAAQLKNAGWSGNASNPTDVLNAYIQTTGGSVTPVGSSLPTYTNTSATPGSPTPTQTTPTQPNNTLDLLKQFAAQTSGVTAAQLAQQKAEFDAQMAFQEKQMQQLGIPQLQINQYLAQLQQQQYQAQVAQVQAQLTGYYQPYTYTPPPAGTYGQGGTFTNAGPPQETLALGQLLGTFNGQQTEAAREYQQNLALQQGQLGQQYLATAAQLQGPQNTFQLSNYLRGAQANTAVPTYLQALAKNLGLPAFQAAGSTAPTPASASGLASQLGGTSSATPGWDYNQTLGTIQNIMSGGAQNLAPGSLEKLTPEELQAFGSGLGALGGSLPSFLQSYQQSRVGQTAPTGVPRLA